MTSDMLYLINLYKMQLSQVTIKRFRSIQSITFDIDIKNNFITICGANNTGKTNVLKALNLFYNPKTYEVENDSPNHKYYGSRGGKSYPEITLNFTDANGDYEITRKFGSEQLSDTLGKFRKNKKTSKLLAEDIQIILDKTVYILIPSINISFPQLINSLINDVYDLEYEKTKFSGLKKDLRETFDVYINGIIDILNQLASEINPAFKEFNPNWSVGFEYSSDIIKFRDLISEDIDFYLNDKSNRNIQGKGSGLQRLGYILLYSRIVKKLNKKNVIMAIDEPDVYLHQGLQKKLKSYLLDLTNKCQVLITTHSPIFIDSYKLNNVFLLDLEIQDEVTYLRTNKTFHPLNTVLVDLFEHDGLKKIQEYLGIKADDYELLDKYNIIVEGECDKVYLEETCKYFDIEYPKIIPSYGASKIEKYLEFYNSFYVEREFVPFILVIFDNDDAGRTEYRKLTKKINNYNNINVRLEFIPSCFGELPKHEDIMNQKVKSNFEIEDFIYPEILLENSNKILKKGKYKTVKFSSLETKISGKSLKEKGILYNIDYLKNEKNLTNGHLIEFTSEQVKQGLSGLYNLKGNKALSDQMDSLNSKYPSVQKHLLRIMDSKMMTETLI